VRTLERLFQTETGMTFGKWRQQLRLLHALRLLAADRAVTAVALEVGYDSPSAFIAAFKSLFGTTPARYFGRATAQAQFSAQPGNLLTAGKAFEANLMASRFCGF
jgi:AraC-like DNA-binding protein